MAGEEKTFSKLGILPSITGSDRFPVLSSGNNYTVTATAMFSNSDLSFVTSGNNTVSTANLVIRYNSAPVTSTSNGIQGQVVWDSNYLYVCVANNNWIRFTGSSSF